MSMNKEQMLAAYDRARPALTERGEALCRELTRLLVHPQAGQPMKLHSLRMRTKDPVSLAHKLARPDRTYTHLWEVTDLLGIRIITYFDDEVDHIGRLIEQQLTVDFQHSVDKRRLQSSGDLGRFGYRSLHYVCHLPEAPVVAPPNPRAAPRFEIQVRTMLEHAWAEIEHDLGYKSRDTMPAAVRRRLHRLAGLLELVDQEFVSIRTELSDYAARLPERLAADEAIPLDRLSLEGLLGCEESQRLDAQIADQLGKPLGEAPFFPDYLLRMLRAAGFHTVAEVREGLRRDADTILAMVGPYFAFSTRTWDLSPDAMTEVLRGYAVFFLAHAHVLGSGADAPLTLDKVMRLARFYRELDYPDDEREAQRVASLLLDAFRDLGTSTSGSDPDI